MDLLVVIGIGIGCFLGGIYVGVWLSLFTLRKKGALKEEYDNGKTTETFD